ncbi:unnamed protein product [Phaeothamnion confervicola]
MATVVGEKEIDLANLSLEQLNGLKGQTEEEIQSLSGNFAVMRDARARYQESLSAVQELGRTGEGREILVPLTSSLYVPGKIVDANRMLVDVGTGYFAEKDRRRTAEFLERKIAMVTGNLDSLKNLIDVKRKNLETLASFMRQRIAQIEARRGAAIQTR